MMTLTALTGPPAQAADSAPRRAYEVVTETALPHLEENLRYATTRRRLCLSRSELFAAFPALSHDSLAGCRLGDERHHEDTISFRLVCDGGHSTTGAARWLVGAAQISGTLDVRLGGKNMTFYQRIAATPLGECIADAN